MADEYRITIRTKLETADAFRELAYREAATLGDMLTELIAFREGYTNRDELCSKLLALKYGNA